MNFTSQICTTREQSKRLLDLGVKAETADMYHYVTSNGTGISAMDDNFLPHMDTLAWSLHRLIEMMPKRLKNLKEGWDMCGHDIAFVITEDLDVNYEEPFEDEPCYNKYFHEGNLYDKIVNSIAWLIKEGYFNKEYLE
jgi:hypothetical protein